MENKYKANDTKLFVKIVKNERNLLKTKFYDTECHFLFQL